MENAKTVHLTPAQKAELLPALTKQRILEEVMDFLEYSDLPTTIESLTDVAENICLLNSMVEKDEAVDRQELHDQIWTVNRFIKHYSSLSWLTLPNQLT